MAEQALRKFEDQLKCAICLDTYTDPKQLQCHHVYCQQCLVRLVIQDQQGQLIMTCPNCRQVTPVPASGVAGLQAAFQINQLLEIVEEHKKAKDTTASAERGTTSPAPHNCLEHGGREVELYCETCGETICFRCIMKNEKHHAHDYEVLNKAFEKEEIMSSLEPMEKELMTIKRALAQFDTLKDEITSQQATTEANIHITFQQLHQTLDVRKTELIGQLHQLTQDKLKSLAIQRDVIETTQAQLTSCLHFMKESLMTGNQRKALQIKSITERQVSARSLLKPSTEAGLIFSASTDTIIATIQNYGLLLTSSLPNPSMCTVTGKGLQEVSIVGEKSPVLLQTLSYSDKAAITCKLVSVMTGTRVEGSVERRGQSQYEISYQPTIKGKHQLHIKVEDQHVRGSPFPVTARSSVEKLGTLIQAITGVQRPEGIVLSQGGEVLVVESGQNCISIFNPQGERLSTIRGIGQNKFKDPHGMTTDDNQCLLVADTENHRIQKFTAEGNFLTEVGTEGSGPLQFKFPVGIVFNASNAECMWLIV